MNGDFNHSTPFAERLGTVQFAIFHPYSSLKAAGAECLMLQKGMNSGYFNQEENSRHRGP